MAKKEGSAQAWVDLNDPRFLEPDDMPLKISSFLRETGQQAKTCPSYIIRVILESLAFSYRKTVRQIDHLTGRRTERVHAVGGGIQNELLAQLTADALGMPVHAGPTEGTIVGNVGVQAIATGAVADVPSWRDIVASSFDVKLYRPDDRAYFEANEQLYDRCLEVA